MQTRRDQLQAYRFQNRRALAALVTGRPNVVEPPMRRLTVTTISGIMIAILIAVGFALFGLLRPASTSSWRRPGSVIVENETGARYVLLAGELHPVLNYPSAVLAVESGQPPEVVHVDRSELAGVRRGSTIGIAHLPDSLPAASELVSAPWTVCSRLTVAAGSTERAQVTLYGGTKAHASPLAGGTALVETSGGGSEYLLTDGQRFTVASDVVARALGLQGQNTAPLPVGHAFLDAIPEGTPLATPHVPGAGRPSGRVVAGRRVRVGQLLRTGPATYSVMLRDGIAAVTPVQAALLQTLSAGRGGATLAPVHTTTAALLDVPESHRDWTHSVQPQLAGLPSTLRPLPTAPAEAGGLCAVYGAGAANPSFAVPPGLLPASAAPVTAGSATTESAASAHGRVDSVVLPPGSGAIVRSADGSPTVYVVAGSGQRFAAASAGVLSGFGYGSVTPVRLTPQLLSLVPEGPPLDPAAARRPQQG